MKKIYTGFAIFSLVALLSFDKTAAEPLKSIESAFISSLPEVKKHKMKNDVNILYLEDELPVTVIYASISFGKMYETAINAGIADVLSRTLSIAGTTSYPGNSMYQKIESIGGEISISAGWETIGIEIKVLSKHSALAFNILGDILKNPVFEDAGVISAKKLVLEKIKRDKDKPDETGVLKLREIIFGGAGYGAVPAENSVGAIDPFSLKTVWSQFATGGNITVAVSSSESEKDVISLAEKEFSAVVKGDKKLYTIDKEKIISGLESVSGNIYLIPAELEQATIYTGTLAPEIKYSGNYALYMMNYILGGGSFSSRLMNEIRVKRGLAYSVYSIVRNRRNAGVFISFVQTRNESAAEALSLIRDNIKLMSEEPVTEEELLWAKESVKNSYVFRFNTINDLLGNFLEVEYNDLDADYYKNYLENINRVTAVDIVNEAGKMFGRGMVTVVVGSRKLEKDLSAFGKVIICE
jgi:predicted Zn-dependent peptidase